MQPCLVLTSQLRHFCLYQRPKALIDDLPWLHKGRDKQAQMGQVGYVCPNDLVLSLGQWRGPVLSLHPHPLPHVKYIPHGRGVDHRLICPVGESGYPDRAGVFLCTQPLYDPATRGREAGMVYCAVDKIYGCSLCQRRELMGVYL